MGKHITELLQREKSLSIESLVALVLQGELLELPEGGVRARPVR